MAHQRQGIREAVQAMLLGNTDAGSNVYSNRPTPYWRSELPAIAVYTGEETATARDNSGRQFIRTLQLRVEIRAEANELVDDVIDSISEQIETIVAADLSLSGTTLGTVYTGSNPELDAQGEIVVGKLTLTFDTKYIK